MMKISKIKSAYLLAILIFLGCQVGISQTKYVIASAPMLKIEGGSTLHDWHMETNQAKGEGVFLLEAGKLKTVQSLNISFQAESLKSGTSGLDKNAYKALKTGSYKEIKFTLRELTGSGSSFTAKGDLRIAGATKSVSFPVKMTPAGNQLIFEGELSTKLTYFYIEPPTALLGTVKTDDEIKISFKTGFQPSI
ncbi:YceI family protein [Algoriphagus confluentis]|uniref:Lipid/polyisoprenoid-binding YceI-like domain-containing protein n=1 Tax=Algoriphagus confluentis TaxID=1697556 RepID=A0ABQ6PPD6_9BACT|nr:hypothetical protein Aconfl_17980 [Algoriphagus confluentis]